MSAEISMFVVCVKPIMYLLLHNLHYRTFKWMYVFVVSRTRFKVNAHPIVAWMSKNSFLEAGAKSEI